MLLPSLYATAFKHSPIGCYLLSTTLVKTILDVNDYFLRNVSLTRKGMIGKELFEERADPVWLNSKLLLSGASRK